jgi:NADH-quinone oxidoreductase subunit M
MLDMAEGGRSLPINMQLLIFAGLFIGFAVKMPVVPLHGWLPLAHVEAPGPVSILLSGVLLKMGAYGLMRAAETLPARLLAVQDWLAVLALLSLLYGALLAWRQQDLKSMIAYSSISHMGIVLLGIAALNPAGLNGAVLQMVAHGLAAALLFWWLACSINARIVAIWRLRRPARPGAALCLLHCLWLAGRCRLAGERRFHCRVACVDRCLATLGMWVILLGLSMLVGAAYGLRVIGHLCRPALGTGRIRDMTKTETLLPVCWPPASCSPASGRHPCWPWLAVAGQHRRASPPCLREAECRRITNFRCVSVCNTGSSI